MTTIEQANNTIKLNELIEGNFKKYHIHTDTGVHAVNAQSKSEARNYLNSVLGHWDFYRVETVTTYGEN